jgi:hypothetical protein
MPDDRESLYIDPSLPVSQAFEMLPGAFRIFLKEAFSRLAKVVTAGKLAELESLASSEDATNTPLSRSAAKAAAVQLGVGIEEVPGIFASATFCVGILVAQKRTTADELVSAGIEAGLIAPSDRSSVHRFAESIIANRGSIADTGKRHRLVQALLPSLTSFSCLVDLRPSFTDDASAINFCVPVVIGHLVNDSTEDVWIQMSRAQVERLILDMQEVLRKVDVLEKWAVNREVR